MKNNHKTTTYILFIAIFFVFNTSCQKDNSSPSTKSNNASITGTCIIHIEDTGILSPIYHPIYDDTIYFPNKPGYNLSLSTARIKYNKDIDLDGQNDDTQIDIHEWWPFSGNVKITFKNNSFNGAGSYVFWSTQSTPKCDISVEVWVNGGALPYSNKIISNQQLTITHFNATIGQHITGSFYGSLLNPDIVSPSPVPVSFDFDVPVTTN